ncbi:MAG TPA: hypothetical protein VL242_02075 [Sorangium sp.]|nr:hypothetical protein [Sorangium sp.]
MASDVTLCIFDPRLGTMVCRRWLGMGGTLDRARHILGRAPHRSRVGMDCWTDLTASEASSIAEASYAGGAGPAEIDDYAKAFPPPAFWWLLVRDY